MYGDDGPSIEFEKTNIIWNAWKENRVGIGYFDSYLPADASPIELRKQRFHVKFRQNPPEGKYAFMGNRAEGYADYRINRCYVSVFHLAN